MDIQNDNKELPSLDAFLNEKVIIKPDIELRSEEVHEVMGKIPPWILRHGITTLSIIVILLLIGSWFFKYPEEISAHIIVTSLEPPVSIIARSTGKIDEIFVENNQQVHFGDTLAIIQNPADTKDMFTLIDMMHKYELEGYSEDYFLNEFENKSLALGSTQSTYAALLNSLNDYKNYKLLDFYPQKIAYQKQQLIKQQEHYNRIVKQESIVREQFKTSKDIFKRDSILLSKDVISDNEHDISKSAFLQNKQAYLSFNASLKQFELQLMQGEENLLDLQQQATELEQKYKLSLHNALEALKAQLKVWERDYLLVSPIKGVVNQMGVWSKNQNVSSGETVFIVTPNHQDTPKGKAMLPIQGSGKVELGQRVNVRLNNYPDQEFGYLIGKVESISSIPTAEGFYVVEITFPNGLITNYGKKLPITQQMQGVGDIITNDLRLIERFFMPIKKLINNQR